MKRLLRPTRDQYDRVPVTRYAVLLFLLIAVLVAAVSVTLVRNARTSALQQSTAALAGAAHVGASSFGTLRSNLRVEASQLAASLELQRAVLAGDASALDGIAAARHAQITMAGRSFGRLAGAPRVASTATIQAGDRVLARVTVAVPLDRNVLTLLRSATPMTTHSSLLLVYRGAVVAGGPLRARPQLQSGRVVLDRIPFAAQEAPLGVRHATLFAVEPISAIDAESVRYRRLIFLAAAVTLALAGALAIRLARPIARVAGEVARLSRQAQTDALTGLANRRSLTERLEAELARARHDATCVCLVIADIDDFKAINDTHGHQTGDEIIHAAAHALAGSIRELDLAARYGGEEFAIVLPGSTLAAAEGAAERMRRAVEEIAVRTPSGESVRTTMSFGVAEFPTYANGEALLAAADAALYQAKRGGKNQVAAATVHAQRGGVPDGLPVEAPVAIAALV